MSTRDDLADARELFVATIDADPEVAERLVAMIGDVYFQRALAAPREVLLESARWAAAELSTRSRASLRYATREMVLAQLQSSDCPLCFARGNDFGRGSASGTPVMPPVTA